MGFGLTPQGFVPMRFEDVLAEMDDDLRTALGQNIQLDGASVLGQLRAIMAERCADLWELLEQVFVSAYLTGASGAALDDLAALAVVSRAPATFSVVTLTLTGVGGTVVPAGSISYDSATGVEWVHATSATIGTSSPTASPSTSGPIVGLTGTITSIRTPVSGWTGVTNAADATVGTAAQTDASLRSFFQLAMRAAGGNSVEGIAALILRIAGVTEAIVVENFSILPDADGRPPKSFETVVRGGDDQLIADTIWFGKPAGIETTGTTTTAVADSFGDGHDILWSRPAEVDIYMIVDYSVEAGFSADGEAEILAAILSFGSGFKIGQDVIPFQFIQRIETENLRELSIRVGLAPNPPSDDPLVIGRTSLAVFDSARVSFNRTN